MFHHLQTRERAKDPLQPKQSHAQRFLKFPILGPLTQRELGYLIDHGRFHLANHAIGVHGKAFAAQHPVGHGKAKMLGNINGANGVKRLNPKENQVPFGGEFLRVSLEIHNFHRGLFHAKISP